MTSLPYGQTRKSSGRLAIAAAHAEAALAVHAPQLVDAYTAALPVAADTVGRRLRGALVREDIGDARAHNAGQGQPHAFDRVEFATAGAADPVDLLTGIDAPGFAAELRNAVVNLAIAMARPGPDLTDPDPDVSAIAAERLAVAGHNLHPCGRTRLGWDTTDVLAHDLEAGHTTVGFIAVRDDQHLGDDVGAALTAAYRDLPAPPPGYRLQPVHAWQRDTILPSRYGDLLRAGAVRILDAELDAVPTAALRTLLLPAGADGRRRYVKVSLDIQVTSTRRSISVASTRNGPVLSTLLHRLVAADPDGHRILLLAETAGAAVPAGSGRDMSAILRDGLGGLGGVDPSNESSRRNDGFGGRNDDGRNDDGRNDDGRSGGGRSGGGSHDRHETVLPGGALAAVDPATGRTVIAGLIGSYARSRNRREDTGAARAWLGDYSRLLLPPLLRLTVHGVALEAHLQNCLPTFIGGVPHRLAVRDFAGLRLHPGRLEAAGHTVDLWPGSVVGTNDEAVLRAKIGYTALQAHLGELVIRLGESHGLDEAAAWRTVRAVVDETYAGLGADPVARADHAAFTAARVPHKALVRMRLTGGGDTYLPVRNPLHAPA